ncbi:hypothetical protein [Chondromyces apiculatus]|uniref:Lipoprotein n=1 Tax=Chondromyces apiculatus DSM 436 TaxID=1192034 RepID=A0A017TCN4_9BACT|nr:hypothetical protein [Chondromyces apiculatus]EYF06682.1 Hypothetical protein CAP_1812 [Chondromyces apiculatus DSM 436]
MPHGKSPRASRSSRPCSILALVVASLASLTAFTFGCDDQPPPAPTAPPSPPASTAPLPSSSAALAPAPGTTTTAAASAAAPEGTILAGVWEGAYDAAKGQIELPARIKDKQRKKDDGKIATGSGKITLTVDADGTLKGQSRGALGDASITGRMEGDILRASVTPDDPHAPQAMSGILVGKKEGDVLRANLRVAGPDALLVRESKVELRRK